MVQIKFDKAADAQACIDLMNNRYFNQRQLKCFYYDGKTNYRLSKESFESQKRRELDFGKWLEDEVKATLDEAIAAESGEQGAEVVDPQALTDEEK